MTTLTTKVSLNKPDYREVRYDIPLNLNFDAIDSIVDVVPGVNKALITSANVVDVFVYNTTNDSDGGEWTKKANTQSWYWETLNTATRGRKREFPAIALIVAETTKVTIFDATETDCPMWMVFNGTTGGTSVFCTASNPLSSISMMNGLLTTGAMTAGALSLISFVNDSSWIRTNNTTRYYYRTGIEKRNTSIVTTETNYYSAGLVNNSINDIAMAIIPGRELNEHGLSEPCIAVATAAGVSIIDGYAGVGTVVDDVYTPIPAIQKVDIFDNRLTFSSNDSFVSVNLSAYLADGSYATVAAWTAARGGLWLFNINSSTYSIPAPILTGSLQAKCTIPEKALAGITGLTFISEDQTTPANSMTAHINKDYNTGWMKGDIRRALICEAGGTTETLTGGTLTDRGVKASSFVINGSLQRSPVATGAELQALSGFSTANYLSQAYSANLDFGTGDFFICGWLKMSPNTVEEFIFMRAYYTSLYSGSAFAASVIASGAIKFTITDDAYATLDGVTSTSIVDTSKYIMFHAIRRSAKTEMWINGTKEAETNIVAATLSLSNTSAVLIVGGRTPLSFPLTNGSISLFRIGAGSLSAEQIAKMYADEKSLFNQNAKCKIQSTSSQVNSLSYDEKENRLFVGTQTGITEFNGLVAKLSDRITNTNIAKALSVNSDYLAIATATNAIANIEPLLLRERIEQVENKIPSNVFGSPLGGNYSEFEMDGHLKFVGEATAWEDANMDPTMLTGSGTLPAAIVFASTGLHIAGFAGNADDEVEGKIEYPHNAKLNAVGSTATKMVFHAHTYPNTTTGGNVYLQLEYLFTKEGVAITTSTTINLTGAVPTTAWEKKTFQFPEITAPEELGSQFHFRFSRVSSNVADTYTGALATSTIGFHYEIDGAGSREMLVK